MLFSKINKVKNSNSRDNLADLIPENGIAAELGVAEGKFSERLIERSNLKFLYSIDCYAGDRGHDAQQYFAALKRLDKYRDRNCLIRLRFNQAVEFFEDEYFDFIYIDGYAHNAQEGGETLTKWFPKLKEGGVFAGDDYSEKYPDNIKVVDDFVKNQGLKLYLINDRNFHHSWFCIKN